MRALISKTLTGSMIAGAAIAVAAKRTEPELVRATQADREFAARWVVIAPENARKIRAGEWDHHHGVQAAARHRLSGAEPELVAPDGWFLHAAAHSHTPIYNVGATYRPLPHAEGPWLVEFQKLPTGGLLTDPLASALVEAWANAAVVVARRDDQ